MRPVLVHFVAIVAAILVPASEAFSFSRIDHGMQKVGMRGKSERRSGLKTFPKDRTCFELRGGSFTAIPALDPISLCFSNHPFAAAFFVCALKASAADMVAQKSSSEEETVNIRRNMAFILYGGLYQGIFQEFLFNGIFPRIFGDGTSALTVAKKVMFDMLFVSPLICLPFAYIIKALVFQQSFLDGVKKYISDVKNNGLLGKYWLVWCPVQCMTFTIIPTQFRISFIACFSFFWLILLSTISSKNA